MLIDQINHLLVGIKHRHLSLSDEVRAGINNQYYCNANRIGESVNHAILLLPLG